MSNDPAKCPERICINPKVPWALFFFLMGVFVFTYPYDFSYASKSVEEIAKVVGTGLVGRSAALLSLGLFAAVSLLRKRRRRLKIRGWLGWLVVVFLVWSFLSIFWADDPVLTFKRLLNFALFSLGALAVAERLSLRQILQFTLFSCSVTLLMGLWAEIHYGRFDPSLETHRFAGVMAPTAQGRNCAYLLVAALVLAGISKRMRSLCILSAVVALAFLMLTKSRMPVFGTLLALITYWALLGRRSRFVLIILGAGVVVCTLFVINMEQHLVNLGNKILYLGRGSLTETTINTLTGRTELWNELLPYVAKRPLLGYGYNAFWTPRHILDINANLGADFRHAHSAYLEVALWLGIPGSLNYLLILVISTMKYVTSARAFGNRDHAFAAVVLVFTLWTGLLDSTMAAYSIATFVVMTVVAKLAFCERPRFSNVPITQILYQSRNTLHSA